MGTDFFLQPDPGTRCHRGDELLWGNGISQAKWQGKEPLEEPTVGTPIGCEHIHHGGSSQQFPMLGRTEGNTRRASAGNLQHTDEKGRRQGFTTQRSGAITWGGPGLSGNELDDSTELKAAAAAGKCRVQGSHTTQWGQDTCAHDLLRLRGVYMRV